MKCLLTDNHKINVKQTRLKINEIRRTSEYISQNCYTWGKVVDGKCAAHDCSCISGEPCLDVTFLFVNMSSAGLTIPPRDIPRDLEVMSGKDGPWGDWEVL